MRNSRPPQRSSLTQQLTVSVAGALVLLLGVILYLLPDAQAQNEATKPQRRTTQDKQAEFVPGEVLVRFRPGTALARNKSKTSVSVSMTPGRSVRVDLNHFGGSELVDGLMLARVAPEDTPGAIKALRARADVAYAEPNFIRHADAVPNDPRYPDLWALKNGVSFPSGGISAESAWDTTTGNQNLVVGVVDSGIDIEHRDLKDNIFVNTGEVPGNNIDDDNNGFIDDVNGWDFVHQDRIVFDSPDEDFHGTHVAGTIGARGNNSIGVVGVNWNVQLLPLKALGLQGTTDARLLEAYSYAKAMRQRGVNLRVLNNSYGGQRFSQSLLDGIKQLGDAGILFIASAGNETLNNDSVAHFPATYDLPNVISVAASTEQGFFAQDFSNFGRRTVHLAAPGQGIVSTTPRGYTGPGLLSAHTEPDGSTYSNFSGTSMAAPHVTGAAALALVVNPTISLEKLRASLLFGADESGIFFTRTMTQGRLNVNRTIQFAVENDSTPPAPPQDFHINSQDGRSLLVFFRESGDDGVTGRASMREIFFTDAVTNERFLLAADLPANPTVSTSTTVRIPFRHTTGQLSMRFSDNVGNTSTASVNVTVAPEVADPYIASTGAPAALTAPNSGTLVGIKGDDLVTGVSLPFPFPFFGETINFAAVSTNGTLYMHMPPDFPSPVPSFGPFDFAFATEPNLEGLAVVAGMWNDMRTDRNATDGIYMVQPDIDRVIFRWQGVTFGSETPVNFEIELRRDGTIQTRYGNGNTNLNPVIAGISGGDPDAHLVATHSSPNGPLSLTNAASWTFALKNPPPPPVADLSVSVTGNPIPVVSGQNVTYQIQVTNHGPNPADVVVMTTALPAGTSFISCTTSHFTGTCTNAGGTITGRINTLHPSQFDSGIRFILTVRADAPPGTALPHNFSTSSARLDPNPANNSVVLNNQVVAESFFGNARAIAAGNSHTSSVKNDGTVWTWGLGSLGQLGDGVSGDGVRALAPLQVPFLSGVEKVEHGMGFVHALKSDGTVWGWGINSNAQLGDGTSSFDLRTRPVQTVGLTNVVGIANGNFYGAAVKSDGTVWVWGADGAITGTIATLHTTPVQLAGIENVTAIASGANHLLMLKSDKTVWSIGINTMGQLGDTTVINRTTPVQVANLSNVARIAAGPEFSVARKEDGTIWTWGVNFSGQLGPNGGAMDLSGHPNAVQVTGLPAGMTEISAGHAHVLAVASDGTVWAWGTNNSGQLGSGPQGGQNPIPRQIPNFGNVVTVAAGTGHSVALKTDGTVWCWGLNLEGEVGDGTSNTVTQTPARVSGLQLVNAPAVNPARGTFNAAVDVTITSPTPGATIHYTINGSVPTESDPVIASGGMLRFTSTTILRARAWKAGMIPSNINVAPFEIIQPPPQLLLEQNGPVATQLAAVDSVLLLRDPLSVLNSTGSQLKKVTDPNTRVILFALHVKLLPHETPDRVRVNLITFNGSIHFLSAEDVRSIPGTDLTQVIIRLPDDIPAGTCQLQLFLNGQSSNIGTIRIKPKTSE